MTREKATEVATNSFRGELPATVTAILAQKFTLLAGTFDHLKWQP